MEHSLGQIFNLNVLCVTEVEEHRCVLKVRCIVRNVYNQHDIFTPKEAFSGSWLSGR